MLQLMSIRYTILNLANNYFVVRGIQIDFNFDFNSLFDLMSFIIITNYSKKFHFRYYLDIMTDYFLLFKYAYIVNYQFIEYPTKFKLYHQIIYQDLCPLLQ